MTYNTGSVSGAAPAPAPTDSGHEHDHAVKRGLIWLARALSYLFYAYLIFVGIILFLGFFLLLFGANPSSSFVEWCYRNLESVMAPFRGIFAPIELGTAGNDVPSVFATSVLFAMFIYGMLGVLVGVVIDWLTDRLTRIDRDREVAAARDQHERDMQAMRDQTTQQNAQRQAAQQAAQTTAQPSAPASGMDPPSPTPPAT